MTDARRHASAGCQLSNSFQVRSRSAENARPAYEYYVGHAEWFTGADGRRLLDRTAAVVADGVRRWPVSAPHR
ncbi:hypothetical protein [Streptomyces shaanxiensis]|uniref:hypothetical protein n=1 Tax=Streptomyces shaanxiensis TaxID=653357 RepID=UPI0031EBB541